MNALLNYWRNIIDTVLDHVNTLDVRAKLAAKVVESVDPVTASEILDYLYF